ncbi:MAG: PAS domain S-box protein [Victivallales bacterium]|nr:PAS domain S-box protein [Victivallales bacterium]
MIFYRNKLLSIIKNKDIKKVSIQKKLNISRPAFWNWEKGKTVPSEENVRKLARILDVKVSEISDLKEKELDKHIFDKITESKTGNNWLKQTHASFEERARIKNNIINGINKSFDELAESKMVISALLNNMDIIFYIKNHLNRYITANNNFIDTMKLNKNYNVNGKADIDLMSTCDAKRNQTEDNAVLKSRKKITYEGIIPNSRKKRWAIIIKTPIFNDDGDVYGLAATYLDITESKIESERRKLLEKNIDLMSVASTVYDKDNDRFIYFNKKALELLALNNETDLKDKSYQVAEIYFKRFLSHDSYNKLINFSQNNNEVFTVEAKIRNKTCLLEIRLSNIEHFGRNYIMAIFYDVTELRLLEEKLKVLDASMNQVNAVVCIIESEDYEKHKENYYITDYVEKLYGYKKEEFYADNYLLRKKIIHEDYVEGYVNWLTKKKYYTEKYRYMIRAKNGELKWCESTASEIMYQNKKCIALIVTDITERIKQEELQIKKDIAKSLKVEGIDSNIISKTCKLNLEQVNYL